jgi:hypothetical protein
MSVLQKTSGKMWIVATYTKAPAEIKRATPTQNCSTVISLLAALRERPKKAARAQMGEVRVKA